MVSLIAAGERVLVRPESNGKGAFDVTATVPSVPRGTYQLSAEGQTSFAYAQSTFVVAPQ